MISLDFPSIVSAQQPVTGGEELTGYVRRLKTMGKKVHLEWLYLENSCDLLPDQKALVRSGRPLEFTEGFLYHGRDGLDEAFLSGAIEGTSYFTRAPHVWAVGAFHEGSTSPAVFVVNALDFNKWRDSGSAVLEGEVDIASGIMDPYPKVQSGFPLTSVIKIWTDADTGDRYERLLNLPDKALSLNESRLKAAVRPWLENKKLIIFANLHHTRLDLQTFYPAAYEIVGRYFVDSGLLSRMPRLKLRGNASTGRTPAPFDFF